MDFETIIGLGYLMLAIFQIWVYKNLKSAEKEMKSMKEVIKTMSEEENIDIEEIFNEINIRV